MSPASAAVQSGKYLQELAPAPGATTVGVTRLFPELSRWGGQGMTLVPEPVASGPVLSSQCYSGVHAALLAGPGKDPGKSGFPKEC